ncbi:MAG TPA: twin-arginine translocase TatA/TatE family subunit [Dermatophilaceae bacterium]|nr:twin-arginine translocase TatA/TatE family subunit [Dermatophilaceae bacterium]
MFDINGWEVIVLVVVAVIVLGPERLPQYAAKLGQGVRTLKQMADGARSQLKDQLGPEFDDVNWRQYDPRQYDPRRIVREALMDPGPQSTVDAGVPEPAAYQGQGHDPSKPTPWDTDAT